MDKIFENLERRITPSDTHYFYGYFDKCPWNSRGEHPVHKVPLSWLANVAGVVPVDIGTGIHDGHTGSVPVGQAIRAYNILAEEKDRISEPDISFIEENEQIPPHLAVPEQDPAYGRKIHLRRQSRSVRLTLFEGGHDMLPEPAFEWLERQSSDCPPDWSAGKTFTEFGESRLGK